MFPFYTPRKHQKTKGGVFRGYKMRTLVRNGLILIFVLDPTYLPVDNFLRENVDWDT